MNDRDTGFRPPQQARSRRTLQRLEDVARELLARGAWHRIGVAALCREAGSSVGAFYARFRDKEGLLDHLAESAASEFDAMLGWCVSDVENRNLPLLSRLRQLVAALQRYVLRHRGVLRAMLDRRRALPWESPAAHHALERVVGEASIAERRRATIAVLLLALTGFVSRDDDDGRSLPDSEAVSQMLVRYLA